MSAPEFSRMLRLDEIGAGTSRHLQANEHECAALAARFGLDAVRSLTADFDVAPRPGGYAVEGRVEGEAVAACVVSGEEVPQRVAEPVEFLLTPATQASAPDEEIELAAGDLDVMPLTGSRIDLGEIAADTFGLALDPYPRANGVSLADARRHLTNEEEAAVVANASPFAVLKRE